MKLLDHITSSAVNTPSAIAFWGGVELTYLQVEEYSDSLAEYLYFTIPQDKTPVIVYGHKNPYMIVAFLACVKSGHPYCPIDISNPDTRTEKIISNVQPHLILSTEPVSFSTDIPICTLDDIVQITRKKANKVDYTVSKEDIFYIIFTSGSTGNPKGVQITSECLDNFLEWSSTLGKGYLKRKQQLTYLNQAPFSFDLSVMDLYTSLYTGSRLWLLDKSTQMNTANLFASLQKSKADVWVSTPSFADVCLSDARFCKELLPDLSTFFFCGEVLTNSTAKKLHERFPQTLILNTYGPTESTVAVTQINVTEEICDEISPLPVGKAKPGTDILIMDRKGNILPEGERGEIVIAGNTVSVGYYQEPDLTQKAFGMMGEKRIYHTGDEGWIEEGMLFYQGRMDLQIKLHGYRMEIEDIENNLLKIEEVERAVVVPIYKDGKVKNLKAVVKINDTMEKNFQTTQRLKERLKEYIPEYMVPKKFIYVDSFPMTTNGKIDRKELGRIIQ